MDNFQVVITSYYPYDGSMTRTKVNLTCDECDYEGGADGYVTELDESSDGSSWCYTAEGECPECDAEFSVTELYTRGLGRRK